MAAPTPDAAVSPTQGIMEPPSTQREGRSGSLDLQSTDMAVSTSDDTTAAPTQGIMDAPSSTQREGRLGFLDLPPEVRNRIYGYLFSNNTIHFDGRNKFPERKFKMYINLCTAPTDDHTTVSRLTGAAHIAVMEEDARKEAEDDAEPRESGPRPVQSREVCNSNKEWISVPSCGCQHSVQLSTQMLRTCRQVYLDAALLPYSTNTFHFSRALGTFFCDAFAEKFSLKQRGAIQTAIMYTLSSECVQRIPDLLPGLKRLWLKSSGGFWWEDYARVEIPSLVGVAVQMGKRLGESVPPYISEDLGLTLLNDEERGRLRAARSLQQSRRWWEPYSWREKEWIRSQHGV